LFAGLKSQGPAFDADGNYVGDDLKLEVEIANGLKLPLNLTGKQVLMGEGSFGGVNILDTMRRLINGMATDDSPAIQGTLEDLGRANDQLSFMRAELGARMDAVKRAVETQQENKILTQGSISKVEDADAVKVFSDLARDQAVLQSAMSTTKKLLTENPADTLFK
jgi:flagellin-like hook-associated protein FlgL